MLSEVPELGINLNPNKCAFMVFSRMILGFIVSKKKTTKSYKNPKHGLDACTHECKTNLGICYLDLVTSDLIGYRFRQVVKLNTWVNAHYTGPKLVIESPYG